MSLFLVYLELGRPVPLATATEPLMLRAVRVRNDGRRGPPKDGVLITDGLAADYFQQYGNHVAARKGEELRAALFNFIGGRLAHGARPVLCFVFSDGLVTELVLPLDQRRVVPLSRLSDEFSSLQRLQAIEVLSDTLPGPSSAKAHP